MDNFLLISIRITSAWINFYKLDLNIYWIPNNTGSVFVGNGFSTQEYLMFIKVQFSNNSIVEILWGTTFQVIEFQVASSSTTIDPSLLEKKAQKVKWIVGWIWLPFLFEKCIFLSMQKKGKIERRYVTSCNLKMMNIT